MSSAKLAACLMALLSLAVVGFAAPPPSSNDGSIAPIPNYLMECLKYILDGDCLSKAVGAGPGASNDLPLDCCERIVDILHSDCWPNVFTNLHVPLQYVNELKAICEAKVTAAGEAPYY